MQMTEKIAAMRDYVENELHVVFGEGIDVQTASSERIERLAGLVNLRRMLNEETPEEFGLLLAGMVELNVHSGAGDEYEKAQKHYLSLDA